MNRRDTAILISMLYRYAGDLKPLIEDNHLQQQHELKQGEDLSDESMEDELLIKRAALFALQLAQVLTKAAGKGKLVETSLDYKTNVLTND